jgi:hypothetical protein
MVGTARPEVASSISLCFTTYDCLDKSVMRSQDLANSYYSNRLNFLKQLQRRSAKPVILVVRNCGVAGSKTKQKPNTNLIAHDSPFLSGGSGNLRRYLVCGRVLVILLLALCLAPPPSQAAARVLTATKTQRLTLRQRHAAQAALQALQRMEAAVQNSLPQADLGKIWAPARRIVRRKLKTVPSGVLRHELQAALTSYEAARRAWKAYVEAKLNSGTPYPPSCSQCRCTPQTNALIINALMDVALPDVDMSQFFSNDIADRVNYP